MSVTSFSELLSNGAGGILLLVPGKERRLSEEQRDAVMALEEHILTTEIQVVLDVNHNDFKALKN